MTAWWSWRERENRAATIHLSHIINQRSAIVLWLCVYAINSIDSIDSLQQQQQQQQTDYISFTTWYFCCCCCCCSFILKEWSLCLREPDRWRWRYSTDDRHYFDEMQIVCCYLSRASRPFLAHLCRFSFSRHFALHSFYRWLMVLWDFAKQIIPDAMWHADKLRVSFFSAKGVLVIVSANVMCMVCGSVSIYVIILSIFGWCIMTLFIFCTFIVVLSMR